MTVVSATVKKPTGAAWAYADVKIGILGAGMSSGSVTAGVAHVQADATGLVSVTLAPNNAGESYVWTNPDRTQLTFRVPSTGGPYTLDQLVVAGQSTPAVILGTLMVPWNSPRPPNVASVIWTGGVIGTPPPNAVSGDARIC